MQENTVALPALRQGIRLEQDGYKFYPEAAERTADPRGREMFRSLADDEKLHLRIVQDQYEGLSAGKGWVSFPQAMERRPEPDFVELSRAVEGEKTIDLDKPLFAPEREALEKPIGVEASDTDALLFALQIENERYELYRKAAIETADPAGKTMY